MNFPLSAAVLAAAALVAGPAIASDTVRASKGHLTIAAPKAQAVRGAAATCHPEPTKGRACRHHVAQKVQAVETQSAFAVADVAPGAGKVD